MKVKVHGYWQHVSGELFTEYQPHAVAPLGVHAKHVLRYRQTLLGIDTMECQTCDVRLWGEPVEEVDM